MPDMKLDSLEDILREAEKVWDADSRDLSTRMLREILVNALKFKRDELEILDLKVINRAMAEFRYAASVFKPYRGIRKVSIFGSARTPEDDPSYDLAVRFSRALVQHSYMVITGAAEGIMKAGNVGAGADKSFGANITLAAEQAPNSVIIDDPKLITFRYFFTRKLFFVMEADAVALFPGGFGTHDEGLETLTLLQTGRTPPMPILLMDLPNEDYWETWDQFVRKQMLKRGLISQADLDLYRIVHSPEDAVAWVDHFYSTYHSMRFVRDTLVLRLEKDLTDDHIAQLNATFSDIVRNGKIARTLPLRAERDEPHLQAKPRLTFAWGGKGGGRITQMIHAINDMGVALPKALAKTG